AYCENLAKALGEVDVFREPLRVLFDRKPIKAAPKRWSWVKKGAPIIVEVGGRDVAGGNVSVLRRDRLYNEAGKPASTIMSCDNFVAQVADILSDFQAALHGEANDRFVANIRRDVTDKAALAASFDGDKPGWVEVEWAKPTGAALEVVVDWLKGHK